MSALDLDELVARCRSDAARAYMREAVGCYQVGAYRSAIVTTWNAILFDLVDKVQELATAGEAAAVEMWNAFQQLQIDLETEGGDPRAKVQAALKWERELLREAKERLHLVDNHQFMDLKRIQDDRNRCAHPTFHRGAMPFQPTPEQVRAHLRHAVEHMLSHPPVQGKALIAYVAAQVVTRMFPHNLDDAKRQIARMLDRPTPAVIKGLADKLLFGYLTPTDSLFRSEGAVAALQGLVDLHRGVAEPHLAQKVNRVCLQLTDAQFLPFVDMIARCGEAWALLDDVGRGRVQEFVQRLTAAEIREYGASIERNCDLEPTLRQKVNELPTEEIEGVVRAGIRRAAVDAATRAFSSATSWVGANSIYNAILQPVQAELAGEHIEAIIRSPRARRNDLIGATSFQQFVLFVRGSGKLPPGRLEALLQEEQLTYLLPVEEQQPR